MARLGRLFHFTVFATVLLFLPIRADAQAAPQKNPCVDWGNVQTWSGTVTISGGGQSTDQFENTYIISESGTINFTLTSSGGPCSTSRPVYQWLSPSPQTSYSVNLNDTISRPGVDSNGNPCVSTTTLQVTGGTLSVGANVNIQLDFTNQQSPMLYVSVGQYVDGVNFTSSGCGSTGSLPPQTEPWGPATTPFPTALPITVSTLSGSLPFQGPNGLGGQGSWTVTWNLVPVVPPVDVVVMMLPSYSTWRPTAGTSETALEGNGLDIVGQLVLKGSNPQQLATQIIPDAWTFNLVQVSQEPGVVLNWPSEGYAYTPSPPDMAFVTALNQMLYPDVTISGNQTIPGTGTIAQLLNPLNDLDPYYIQIGLNSFDWGGWATINVTAIVNGQPIQGHIDGQTTTNILLPERQPGSSIADSWKNAHGIPLFTSDDSDFETLSANDENPGDGLTLYEEYRGFYVHCPPPNVNPSAACLGGLMHVEGDPTKKDLFVVNDAGPEVLAGMKYFQAGTGINVCCDTLKDDQITSDHIINFNHSQGAHEGDQHAVVIVRGNGNASPCTLGGPAQPKNIQKIYYPTLANILAQAEQEGGSARVAWANGSYPAKVAHELGHSVNVFHHGESDTKYVNWTTPDGVSLVETYPTGGSIPIQAFYENQSPVLPSQLGLSPGGSFKIYLGLTGGQHSGDVFCFMRYNVSQDYIANTVLNTTGNTRFYVPEREEPGLMMTNTAAGTGTNLANRSPQSRYGDATRGSCLFQVCVNDSLNPQSAGTRDTSPCPGQTN